MPTLVLASASPWTRHPGGAMLTGTCEVLARSGGLPVWVVRLPLLACAVLCAALLPLQALHEWYSGTAEATTRALLSVPAAPVLLYVLLWWALPNDREHDRSRMIEAATASIHGRPSTVTGEFPSLSAMRAEPEPWSVTLLRWLALAALSGLSAVLLAMIAVFPLQEAIAGTGILSALGAAGAHPLAVTVLLVGLPTAGVVLGLLPLQLLDRLRWSASSAPVPRAALLTLALAIAALTTGALAFVGLVFGLGVLLATSLIVLVTALLAALLIVPWARHLWRAVTEETQQRALVQQRSEITAHLHDSVLQTLTLLQRPGFDIEDVRRLARGQERELRRWLYRADEPEAGAVEEVRRAVEAITAELEDLHGTAVQTVVVGDYPVTDAVRPLLGALREAASNACRHGREDVDVFVDISAGRIEAFVRDRGPGFDLESVPHDRLGVRESIIGRMERAGGSAQVHRAPGGGTEIALDLPIARRAL